MSDADVIGGGPSGVAAAVELRRHGVERVMLLDREPHLGGATRHCSHSPFGMREFGRVYFGAAYGRRLESEAARAGVDVRTGHSVVRLLDGGRIDVTSERGVGRLSARRLMIATRSLPSSSGRMRARPMTSRRSARRGRSARGRSAACRSIPISRPASWPGYCGMCLPWPRPTG